MKLITKAINNKTLYWLSIAIILLGITLRAIFYFQNRCLFIDEANVARNIYERGFAGLTSPLSYEQYAPPAFLWIIKCATLLFGYSEFACRLYPFLCGIASLPLFYSVLKKFTTLNALWYPLFIFATGFIYIRYSAELKQYISDVVVVLALILFALRFDIFKIKPFRFFLLWGIIGSVTIWLSMPGVFMLAGIGAYYGYEAVQKKNYKQMILLVCIAAIWLLQFALYYYVILKPQINSTYLQNCHKEFFLYFTPVSDIPWASNLNALDKLIEATGGKWALSVVFHLATLLIGALYLFFKERGKFILLIVPLIALLVAAAFQQYALTPRLVLFIMPVLLILIGTGLHVLLQKGNFWSSALLVVVAAICIFNFSSFSLFYKRMDNEEITQNLSFLIKEKINEHQLCVHNLAAPAFIYYTTIHPSKDKWASLKDASFLNWNSNYDSLARSFHHRWALLYSWMPDDELNSQQAIIEKYWKVANQNTVPGGKAFIYDVTK